MADTPHTPTPWKATPIGQGTGDYCIHAKGIPWQLAYLAENSQFEWPIEANAAFIVRAVNSLASHEARIAELEGALRPFARHAGALDDPRENDTDSIAAVAWLLNGGRSKITVGDLRAARRALHTEGE